jgi:hypothetical protein
LSHSILLRFVIKYSKDQDGLQKLKSEVVKAISDVATRAYKFKIQRDEVHQFRDRLEGEDGYLYDFRLNGYFGSNAVEVELRMMRYGAGIPDKELPGGRYGLAVGESLPVPHIPWILRLESSSGEMATFRLVRK